MFSVKAHNTYTEQVITNTLRHESETDLFPLKGAKSLLGSLHEMMISSSKFELLVDPEQVTPSGVALEIGYTKDKMTYGKLVNYGTEQQPEWR